MKILYIILTLTIQLFVTITTDAKNIFVGKNGQNKSIQIAIRNASDNDTIIIRKGCYFVNSIIIDKPITIAGIDFPILDANNKNEIFNIIADSVTIKGLVLKNIPTSFVNDNSAIRLNQVTHCEISDNKILNSFFGIYLKKSNHCIIKNNKIIGSAVKEFTSGNAIHLWYSNDNVIQNNRTKRHRDGIYLEFVKNSLITNNISQNNLRYGLHFMFCDSNSFIKNVFKKNGAGVAVMFSRNVDMIENTFSENTGPASYGLLLKEIFDSKILRNNINSNTVGIYAEGATRCNIKNNLFANNGWAIKIFGSSTKNLIMMNNFISNTFEIASNASENNNLYTQNYWGKYSGYDINKDGKGDVPYRPVKLFSFITANSKESLILLRSLFILLIEIAESITPVFTPSDLLDNQPLMEPL